MKIDGYQCDGCKRLFKSDKEWVEPSGIRVGLNASPYGGRADREWRIQHACSDCIKQLGEFMERSFGDPTSLPAPTPIAAAPLDEPKVRDDESF